MSLTKENICREILHGGKGYEFYLMLHKVMQFYNNYVPSLLQFVVHDFRLTLFWCVGLSYLHHGCNIIHRDVKSSNILLSENLEGKMSDFGISRLTPYGTDNAATTRVVGTPGYLDPA